MASLNVFGAENRQHIEIKYSKAGKEWVAMGKKFFSVSCRTVSLHVPSFNGLHCKFTKIVPFILGWGNDVIDNEYRRHSYSSAISTRVKITNLIIRCVFFFLSTGREFTTWTANNCLQIMVCSCVVPSKRVLLQIIFCSCVFGTMFSRKMADHFPEHPWSD